MNEKILNKYYVYRHIRLDKNQPFYIGISSKLNKNFRSEKAEYFRAYTFTTRNKIWNDIKKKTDIDVEIIFETTDYELLLKKEKEFIKLYGRIDLKTGILANMTDGGEGIVGLSDEVKKIIGMKNSGKNSPNYGRKGKDCPYSKPVYQYDLEGNFIKKWDCARDIDRELKISYSRLSNHILYKRKKINNYIFRFELYTKEELLAEIKLKRQEEYIKHLNLVKNIGDSNNKIVYQYDMLGNFIKEWKSIKTASKALNIKEDMIRYNCQEKIFSCKNKYIFRYTFEMMEDIIQSLEEFLIYNKKIKPIYQYNLEGKLIRYWSNSKYVELFLGIKRATLLTHIRLKLLNCMGYGIFRFGSLTENEIKKLQKINNK